MDFINHPRTPFLFLPREIRDIVYKYIVNADHPVYLTFQLNEDTAALFRVCRQVHKEVIAAYHKTNAFFVPETLFRFGKPLRRVPTPALIYRLNAARLGMVMKLDVEMPIAYSSTKTRDRKVLAKFKTFVKILATYGHPHLQLRFLCYLQLNREARNLVKWLADLVGVGVSLTYLDMQRIRNAAMRDRWSGLQLLPSALRIVRGHCGGVRWHAIVMVHPVLVCQAKEALISHNIPSYLLQSRLETPPLLWDTVPSVLRTFGAPEATVTTARELTNGYFLECPLDCLKRENAWVWRFCRTQGVVLTSARRSVE